MSNPVSGVRLDRALVERGLARSRTQAQELIRAGRVTVDGRDAVRASEPVGDGHHLEARTDPYVSRAAHKLLGALDDLGEGLPPLDGARVLDAGSSTGGFTQVLLERGVAEVHAVDVGTDQLVPLLRDDPRVHVHERTNLRELTLDHVGGAPVDLVVADVSFISLTLLLERFSAVTTESGAWLLMVKPQFEVGRAALGKDGVVRDPAQRVEAVRTVVAAAGALGWHPRAAAPSRLPGPAGNEELFVHLARGPRVGPGPAWDASLC